MLPRADGRATRRISRETFHGPAKSNLTESTRLLNVWRAKHVKAKERWI